MAAGICSTGKVYDQGNFNGWERRCVDDEQVQCDRSDVMKPYGVELSDEMFTPMVINVVRSCVLCSKPIPLYDNELASAVLDQRLEMARSCSDNLPLFDGIENFIKKSAQEFAVGVVSMAKREEIALVLNLSGLARHFSVILSAEAIVSHKPDPACYREGFRQIDLFRIAQGHLPMVHADCLVIEDSPQGVQAGKAADLPVLGVANTVSADKLREAGADWIAKRLDDWMPESMRRVFN